MPDDSTPRKFPAPWRSEKISGGYVVRDANGQALAYVYGRATMAEAMQGALAPAYDHGFDARARYSIPPITATPSTQEGDYVCPYVILAKNFKRLVRRRYPFMNEGIDALLPCCHASF